MPGWQNLDKLLQEARAGSGNRQPPEQDSQNDTLVGLRRLLDPVYAVFDKLREEGIHLQPGGAGSIPRPVPNGAELQARVIQTANNAIDVQLDPVTRIIIRIATKIGLTYPDVVTTAKYRCTLAANGTAVESILIDSRDSVAKWIFQHVLAYSRPMSEIPALPGGDFDVEEEDEPLAELDDSRPRRVIDLDS